MTLMNKDASIILGMVARGDKRHDIAAWFGENQARIAEVEQGQYGNLTAAPTICRRKVLRGRKAVACEAKC